MAWRHSRNASTGSIREARSAGDQLARAAIAIMRAAAAKKGALA
jgi:hypothetical protein